MNDTGAVPRREDLLLHYQRRERNRHLAPCEELRRRGPLELLEFRQPLLMRLNCPRPSLVFKVTSRQLAVLTNHPVSEQNQKNAGKHHRGTE